MLLVLGLGDAGSALTLGDAIDELALGDAVCALTLGAADSALALGGAVSLPTLGIAPGTEAMVSVALLVVEVSVDAEVDVDSLVDAVAAALVFVDGALATFAGFGAFFGALSYSLLVTGAGEAAAAADAAEGGEPLSATTADDA